MLNIIVCQKKSIYEEFYCITFLEKKSAAEIHRILVVTDDDHILKETMCRDWFQCFMNNDFDFEDKENYATPK